MDGDTAQASWEQRSQLAGWTCLGFRDAVAPPRPTPDRAARLGEQAYRTLFERLGELVGTLVLDCGTGFDDPPARAALSWSNQLVMVCDDEPDTASIVVEAAGWRRRIRPPLTLVVNNVRRSSQIEIAALEHKTEFAPGLAVIPRDETVAAGLHGSRFSCFATTAGQSRARGGDSQGMMRSL